ncbi:SAYSvFN domain-containing protein 1 [Dendroctonus ponderosae]|uniref:SAYSvFN domain-containing protein n=1 Tax=Dendroctonus ponderosae TaxID=77166 RepID=U4UGY6_DENPD|nr:SAYSvFN domain-containing protein 1 [Dendroctonus ponderosae]ERL92292.1 hypothetical protein D910_09609 [Dendroctonus ponderosae]KAH1015069.1 hypothetical protein HUJ05_012849 [Dendroctonus ponderosae]
MLVHETEKKLAAYRARKKREALINHYKARVKNMLPSFLSKKDEPELPDPSEETSRSLLEVASPLDEPEDCCSEPEEPQPFTTIDYVRYLLYFLLWVTTYALFIQLQFGTVFLIVSGLMGIFLNTRTGPKKANEISAYSVFNKNCEKIDGTLDGEKMTQQMLYGGFAR